MLPTMECMVMRNRMFSMLPTWIGILEELLKYHAMLAHLP